MKQLLTINEWSKSTTNLNEMEISNTYMDAFVSSSGLRKQAILDFIKNNDINVEKMFNDNYTKTKVNPLEFGRNLMTAISGRPNNTFFCRHSKQI